MNQITDLFGVLAVGTVLGARVDVGRCSASTVVALIREQLSGVGTFATGPALGARLPA